MVKLTPEFISAFQKALDNLGPANEVFQECMDILSKQKLLYTIGPIKAKYFLPHKQNRGSLMLSPYNAHANAKRIHLVGADLKQLTNAVCIELAPEGVKRDEQIGANLQLNARAKGLLAPVNYEERYLTLGTGHTAAFCKLADVGGPTPENVLRDADGNIDVTKLRKNKQFKVMIDEGWEWQVVPHEVDAMFPKFAQIAQRALNTRNHVSTEVGELEAAVTLAQYVDEANDDVANWKVLALDSLTALCVPCAGYASVILDFCALYGGGPGAPQIKFMDSVAKQFSANVVLGETFWTSITNTKFASMTSKCPLLRVALALANLSSDKKVDGVARLVTPADVGKVSGKGSLALAMQCEMTLKDALDIADALINQGKCDDDASLAPKGQLFVRIALLSIGKGKAGRESKAYSLDEIQRMYLDALSKIAGQVIEFTKWDVQGDPEKKEVESKPTRQSGGCPSMASLSDHSDPIWVARQAGFVVGANVVEKGQGQVKLESIFTIRSIDAECVLSQATSYNGNKLTIQVSSTELVTNWSINKLMLPVKVCAGEQRAPQLAIEAKKCAIFKSIMDCDVKNAATKSLIFWRRPDEVRTSQRIAKGALVLAPVCAPSNISLKYVPGALELGKHEVNGKELEFFVLPQSRPTPKEGELDKFPPEATVAAFWWVRETHVKKEANMAIEFVTKHGITIPMLKNTIDLEPFSKLEVFKLKSATTALKNASIIEGNPEPKKRKRSV